MTLSTPYDVIVIGAGIAGLSAAYELSKTRSVLVLEQEEHPGYHATGRSAAVYAACYGSEQDALYALVQTSWDFFANPPDGFSPYPLTQHRGVLFVSDDENVAELKQHFSEMSPRNPKAQLVGEAVIREKFPALNENYRQAAIYDPRVYDIDVSALQEGYLKAIRQAGSSQNTEGALHSRSDIKTSFKATDITRSGDLWTVSNGAEHFTAPYLVNAAGAWVDQVAEKAGVAPLDIKPLRRSAILIDGPEGPDVPVPADWSMVVEFREEFFFKPDAGKLMACPANEDLSEPCDAQPEELDIAYAAHYVEQALSQQVKKIDHSWAGLRSFAPDREPVIGFDPKAEGFFWVAGQGGYGIQTAPAAGRLVAALITGKKVPEDMAAFGLTEALTSPARFTKRS